MGAPGRPARWVRSELSWRAIAVALAGIVAVCVLGQISYGAFAVLALAFLLMKIPMLVLPTFVGKTQAATRGLIARDGWAKPKRVGPLVYVEPDGLRVEVSFALEDPLRPGLLLAIEGGLPEIELKRSIFVGSDLETGDPALDDLTRLQGDEDLVLALVARSRESLGKLFRLRGRLRRNRM